MLFSFFRVKYMLLYRIKRLGGKQNDIIYRIINYGGDIWINCTRYTDRWRSSVYRSIWRHNCMCSNYRVTYQMDYRKKEEIREA